MPTIWLKSSPTLQFNGSIRLSTFESYAIIEQSLLKTALSAMMVALTLIASTGSAKIPPKKEMKLLSPDSGSLSDGRLYFFPKGFSTEEFCKIAP